MQWLKLLKEEDGVMQCIDEDLMERVIEELELGWNVLTQPLRKLQQRKEAAMFPDEVPCEICGECDTSNCNVIVLCDDCDLAVHQECYGVSHIPEGPWLCRPCCEKKANSYLKAQCMLCPWPGGALRKTNDHRWVHSLCAHMVPETTITFAPSDPYDSVDVCTLHADRAKLRCVLCRWDPQLELRGNGYPIQCASKLCHVAFHPMCARAAGWNLQYSQQKAYCCKHAVDIECENPNDAQDCNNSSIKLRLNLPGSNSSVSMPLSPTKNKYPSISIGENCPLHVTRGGEKLRIPCFAPKVLIEHIARNERVFQAAGIPASLRSHVVKKISKYWALKREHRRGTTLLKSLQLEPGWSQSDAITEEAFSRELSEKIALVERLRGLENKLRILREREVAKLQACESSAGIFEILSSPFTKILEKLVLKLQKEVDQPGYFAYPVPCDIFPDYPLIVKYPMDFSTILKNLRADSTSSSESNKELFYPTLQHFFADLQLIWENSRLYNTRTSVFYLAADRLEFVSRALIEEIWRNFQLHGITGPFDILNLESSSRNVKIAKFDYDNLPESTPARFPKSNLTPIGSIDSVGSGQASAGSSASVIKRRGRPPKRRDGPTGSIDSIGSSEDGELREFESEEKKNVSKQQRVNVEKIKGHKRRGRPPKKRPVEDENEDGGAVVPESKNSRLSDPSALFWVKLKSGNWCPGELFVDPEARASRRNDKTVRLFDAFKTIVAVDESCLKPLTPDFEADFEALHVEGVTSKKMLISAHRQALSTLK